MKIYVCIFFSLISSFKISRENEKNRKDLLNQCSGRYSVERRALLRIMTLFTKIIFRFSPLGIILLIAAVYHLSNDYKVSTVLITLYESVHIHVIIYYIFEISKNIQLKFIIKKIV